MRSGEEPRRSQGPAQFFEGLLSRLYLPPPPQAPFPSKVRFLDEVLKRQKDDEEARDPGYTEEDLRRTGLVEATLRIRYGKPPEEIKRELVRAFARLFEIYEDGGFEVRERKSKRLPL